MSARIFIDTNVILDILLGRERNGDYSAKFFEKVVNDEHELFISSKSVVDIHYQMKKVYQDVALRKMLKIFLAQVHILDINNKDCLWALDSPIKDYEDAVQIECAVRAGMDLIVTNNKKDFKGIVVPVYTPREFVEKR